MHACINDRNVLSPRVRDLDDSKEQDMPLMNR
jgi:hypothetical protein